MVSPAGEISDSFKSLTHGCDSDKHASKMPKLELITDGSPVTVTGKSTLVLLSGMGAGSVVEVLNVCE